MRGLEKQQQIWQVECTLPVAAHAGGLARTYNVRILMGPDLEIAFFTSTLNFRNQYAEAEGSARRYTPRMSSMARPVHTSPSCLQAMRLSPINSPHPPASSKARGMN